MGNDFMSFGFNRGFELEHEYTQPELYTLRNQINPLICRTASWLNPDVSSQKKLSPEIISLYVQCAMSNISKTQSTEDHFELVIKPTDITVPLGFMLGLTNIRIIPTRIAIDKGKMTSGLLIIASTGNSSQHLLVSCYSDRECRIKIARYHTELKVLFESTAGYHKVYDLAKEKCYELWYTYGADKAPNISDIEDLPHFKVNVFDERPGIIIHKTADDENYFLELHECSE